MNEGFGRDTSNLLLARFRKDLEPLNAQYNIIQIGTNDLFEASKDGYGNQSVLDSYVANLKANIMEMVNICYELKVIPIVGNLIPRTGFKGIYRQALWSFNDWVRDYCNENNIFYIDFYNAGKNNIPPTPLEDVNEAGAMSPHLDGDSQYDEHGNLVIRGNGIHPNIQGR